MIIAAFNPVGPFIAIVYVIVIGSIITWMLRIPSAGDVEQHAKRITRQAGNFAKIAVPVQADIISDRLVALASQMAKFRGASMDVVYVIEVPYTLPLTAVMPDQEKGAQDTFVRAEKIATRYGVKINRQVERARHAGPAIVSYAKQNGVDLLFMGDQPNSNRRGTKLARTVEYVFENAPCEVLIDRPPME